MSEVKALTLVNRPTHPFAKVVVVQCTLLLAVKVLQDFDEVKVVKQVVARVSKETHDIFRRDLPVFVNVEIEEGLSDGDPGFRESVAKEVGQLGQSLLDEALLFLLQPFFL